MLSAQRTRLSAGTETTPISGGGGAATTPSSGGGGAETTPSSGGGESGRTALIQYLGNFFVFLAGNFCWFRYLRGLISVVYALSTSS